MISFDTNLLFAALEPSHADHAAARAFLDTLSGQEVAVCELVLMEVYVLVSNPLVCARPLDAVAAGNLIQTLRTNPAWRLLDYPGGLMNQVWKYSCQPGFARRRVFDACLGLTLLHHGVTIFATRNAKDFADLGFVKVWDPINEA